MTGFIRAAAILIAGVSVAARAEDAASVQSYAPSPQQLTSQSAVTGVVGACLARSEESVCRTLVNANQARGAFGEAVMERVVLRSGDWWPVGLSPAPQGIDGVYLKHDAAGRPRGLLVAEAKYGSSRLGTTSSGSQLSRQWISKRLAGEASRYMQVAGLKTVRASALPSNITQRADIVRVRLSGGGEAAFWRSGSGAVWQYDGPADRLADAQKAVGRDGKYLRDAADGKISYRSRLYGVQVKGNEVTIQTHDALPNGDTNLSLSRPRTVALSHAEFRGIAGEQQKEVIRQLSRKLPHLSEEDLREISASVASPRNMEELAKQTRQSALRTVSRDMAVAATAGGVIGAIVDTGIRFYGNERIQADSVGASALVGAVAGATGAATEHAVVQAAIRNDLVHQFFQRTATSIGLSNGTSAARLMGRVAGGSVASAVVVGGLYATGAIKADDALGLMAVSGVSVASAIAAESAIMSLVAGVGTASTGTAISSLSGAAATNASLAWLGGGAVSAGGGGVAAGSVVLTGGVVVVAAAATYAVVWGVGEYNNADVSKRAELSSRRLLDDPAVMRRVCERRWQTIR